MHTSRGAAEGAAEVGGEVDSQLGRKPSVGLYHDLREGRHLPD